MAQEIKEAPSVFRNCIRADGVSDDVIDRFTHASALFTIARGSSDAVATVLAYEFMRELKRPTTSLPPSVFSLNDGLRMQNAAVMIISQSGASEDLVRSATAARANGASVCAITNVPSSAVEEAVHTTLSINAGAERAVPATKTVIGSIAAGMNLLASFSPSYASAAERAAQLFPTDVDLPILDSVVSGLLRAQNVHVIGRGAGLGAAQEVA